MKSNYERILTLTLQHEGGYVNHPKDPGGATNKGITQRVYNAYRRSHGSRAQSVKRITPVEVRAIYREEYWDPVRGDKLPSGIDYAVYDFAVNSGVSRAAKYLQAILGVDVDGSIGTFTIRAAQESNIEAVIKQLCNDRLAFMKRARNRKTGELLWASFGRGWHRRVMGSKAGFQTTDKGVIDIAVMLARHESATEVVVHEAPGKTEPGANPAPGLIQFFVEILSGLFGGGKR